MPLRTSVLLAVVVVLAAGPASAGPRRNLKPHRPIVCKGNRDITLFKRVIETKGNAITLIGNCDVLINKSVITAGEIAIKVVGNGDVKIRDSEINGARVAVQLLGNADVYAKGSTFNGRIVQRGNGEFHDEGGNRFNKKGRAAPRPEPAKPEEKPAPRKPGKLKKAAPINCVGSRPIRLTNRLIKTGGDAIVIKGSCNVTLEGCRVEAGKIGINSMGSGRVTLKNSYLEGGAAAVSLLGSGDVVLINSEIHGKIRRLGTGRLVNKGSTIKR